jgi:ATP-dependent DNA helicase RecQ
MLAAHAPSFVLRPFQKEAIDALSRPGHVICVAPTGSGKSLIYETLARKHRIALVTPLVALARQQHSKLLQAGIPTWLGAGPEPENPSPSKSGVWILSPERLAQPPTIERLKKWNASLLTVDECHCLWDWGERFRPSFMKIPEILRQMEISRSLWLTATLPSPARSELRSKLPEPQVEIGEFALPPSLYLRVQRVPLPARLGKILDFVFRQSEPGIIFVQTRSAAERLTRLLSASDKKCAIYHAGMASEERRLTEKKIVE